MLLSGKEIKKNLGDRIVIEPFQDSQLNPNSYNLRLANELLVYESDTLDMKKDNAVRRLTIPESGLLLEPNKLYLGRTMEYTKTDGFMPMLEGRSSVGRLGLFVHVTAGFGDVGFAGYWTLEMFCIHPIVIYPGVELCQIYYHTIQGDYDKYEGGKYQNNQGVQSSMLYKDFVEKQLEEPSCLKRQSRAYDAQTLAKYIITKCEGDGCPVSNMHLQKILYCIQRLFLRRGETAFHDVIEAWCIGPVVPAVYSHFCGFGAMPISLTFDADEEIDGAETGIDRLVEEMREMMPWEITKDIEREGGAWERTRNGGSAPDKKITHDMIRQFG